MFVTPKDAFHRVEYRNEADLEDAIIAMQDDLFGRKRIYLPVKKKIGKTRKKGNIPDGYLIDLSPGSPRLYVVENELDRHDVLNHIAVQILEFALSFEQSGHAVKRILLDALQADSKLLARCESLAPDEFRNLDHLLEHLVFNAPFAALVVIDRCPDELETILTEKFQFGVEILEFTPYENAKGVRAYDFEPFLAEVEADSKTGSTEDLDTIVVPAREDGAQEVFLGEDRWYAIRINGTMIPQIKHIAMYQVAPISAITHIAPVASIEPWKDSGKYVVNFAEPAEAIGPVTLAQNGRVKAPQASRYAVRTKLEKAKTLDGVW